MFEAFVRDLNPISSLIRQALSKLHHISVVVLLCGNNLALTSTCMEWAIEVFN